MKKTITIIMSLVMMLSLLLVPTTAEDICAGYCEHTQEFEIVPFGYPYPPCPNDSTHSGRKFMNLGADGHLVYCKVCNATILSIDDHIWSVDFPDCTMGKYCIVCNYQVPGRGALGHDVYPEADNEYIAIDSEIHGHICLREECPYNPDSYDYEYTVGYLEDEPSGSHLYFSPVYYTTYQGATDGKWRHMKYQDCAYCDYTNYVGWIFGGNNNSNCQGGCVR